MSEPVENRRAEREADKGPEAASEKTSSGADTQTDNTRTDSQGGQNRSGGGSGRRRGGRRRGGRGRGGANRSGGGGSGQGGSPQGGERPQAGADQDSRPRAEGQNQPDELPEPIAQGRVRDPEAAERALVRRPQIGDTMPAPAAPEPEKSPEPDKPSQGGRRRRRRRGGRGKGGGGGGGSTVRPVQATAATPVELGEEELAQRRGRERKGRPVGRYMMAVSVRDRVTQIAVLEGRNLIEHYVSRPADDETQIHGNIYLGRVENVLPGMEAAFVDIGTPKNAVLYRGDVQYDAEDIEQKSNPRIEQLLRQKQRIICQVTKNPIGHKGARLTQEVSLPGRFVVLVPNSRTYGISKRLSDDERKRLRSVLDGVRPEEHGIIVRTAAENVTAEEIQRDVANLVEQWKQIEKLASQAKPGSLLYREPDMALRVIREEFNADYRAVVIDDRDLYEEVSNYVGAISPALADRVQLFDPDEEPLSLFEHHHVHEQLHKALDTKVWLPSGGSLIIEHTEALTVIDVNTGKNVGSSSLEETVFRNNLEAAEEIAKQLRLRDIGGIIVIDFIDMEVKGNRDAVIKAFRDALARDKTRTQVFDISDLGLVEMTRKRIGEGLLESVSKTCPECEGRGIVIESALLD